MAVRYLAQRVTGDGVPGPWLGELPLSGVAAIDVLSGPPQLAATLDPAVARLRGPDNKPVLLDWGTAIYCEVDQRIDGGWLLVGSPIEGSSLRIDGSGFCGYPAGMPYSGDYSGVQVDPLEIHGHIWEHLQSQPGGNLGLILGGATSPVRIGTPEEDVSFETGAGEQVGFEAGPYRLNWWSTDDLGSEVDKLARETPFDYHERHAWNADQTEVLHYLDRGYPRLGRRRTDLRYVLGESVTLPPVVGEGGETANEIWVIGAGEGRNMIRGTASRRDGRIRRVAQVEDKRIGSLADASSRARRDLSLRLDDSSVNTVAVRSLGTLRVGDEIRLQAEMDWTDLDQWVRVVSVTKDPSEGEAAVLQVVRSEAA